MTLDQSIIILRRFQDWRRGLDYRPMVDAGISPEELGKAIDVILKHHGQSTPMIDCSRCKYGNVTFGCCRLLDGITKRKPADKLQYDKFSKQKEHKDEHPENKNHQ